MSYKRKSKNDPTLVVRSKSLHQDQVKALGSGKIKPEFAIHRTSTFLDLFKDIEDWALEDEWEHQTFDEFDTMERWKVTKIRRTIFLLPLDLADVKDQPSMNDVAKFVAAYFSLPVQIMDPVSFADARKGYVKIGSELIDFELNEYGDKRFNVISILDYMIENIPPKAYCVLAVTSRDIFEEKGCDNFIMGRGTGDRIGVLSMYRFNPKLNLDSSFGSRSSNSTSVASKKWFFESAKTLAHETMHMFGLDHCTYFICVMNANVDPTDQSRDSIHLCPICFKKLQHAIKFNSGDYLKDLMAFYKELDWSEEFDFVSKRISLIELK